LAGFGLGLAGRYRLRHQNGQVHTIPFGQVQAVTNFSRDWSVIKFNLQLDPMAFGTAGIRFAAPNFTMQLSSAPAA